MDTTTYQKFRQLKDRTEFFDSIVKGACSCGEPVHAVINSSCTPRTDKVRYHYPKDSDAWCIFCCKSCKQTIDKSFKYQQP